MRNEVKIAIQVGHGNCLVHPGDGNETGLQCLMIVEKNNG